MGFCACVVNIMRKYKTVVLSQGWKWWQPHRQCWEKYLGWHPWLTRYNWMFYFDTTQVLCLHYGPYNHDINHQYIQSVKPERAQNSLLYGSTKCSYHTCASTFIFQLYRVLNFSSHMHRNERPEILIWWPNSTVCIFDLIHNVRMC